MTHDDIRKALDIDILIATGTTKGGHKKDFTFNPLEGRFKISWNCIFESTGNEYLQREYFIERWENL